MNGLLLNDRSSSRSSPAGPLRQPSDGVVPSMASGAADMTCIRFERRSATTVCVFFLVPAISYERPGFRPFQAGDSTRGTMR